MGALTYKCGHRMAKKKVRKDFSGQERKDKAVKDIRNPVAP